MILATFRARGPSQVRGRAGGARYRVQSAMVQNAARGEPLSLQRVCLFGLWACLFFLACSCQLGPPAIIVSIIIAIYVWGLREKWSGEEWSAYSVYNKGQTAIAGSYTAAQFDKQVRVSESPSARGRRQCPLPQS